MSKNEFLCVLNALSRAGVRAFGYLFLLALCVIPVLKITSKFSALAMQAAIHGVKLDAAEGRIDAAETALRKANEELVDLKYSLREAMSQVDFSTRHR